MVAEKERGHGDQLKGSSNGRDDAISERYISERLLQEILRPLINFLWYLWEAYGDLCESDFRISVEDSGADGQRITVQSAGITVIQHFGHCPDVEIAIRKCGARYIMEYH